MKHVLPIIGFLSCATLSACIPPPPQTPAEVPAQPQTPQERTEPALHDSEAPLVAGTGSVLTPERLLQNGVIDIGNRDAPLALLVFTEYHCRYCQDFQEEHVTKLMADFVQAGNLRLQFVPFPLKKYEYSQGAAHAALCAAEQNKGMLMQTQLFEQPKKDRASVLQIAQDLKLEHELFTACLDDPGTELLLKHQGEWARSLGVQYVPTFFLNGEKFVGLPEYADIRGRIEAALAER